MKIINEPKRTIRRAKVIFRSEINGEPQIWLCELNCGHTRSLTDQELQQDRLTTTCPKCTPEMKK